MRPSSTTAAAVSSHDVSIPRMRVTRTSVARTRSCPAPRRSTPSSNSAVLGRVDLVRPHDERVLAGVGVVALADADRHEAEPAVQLLRAACCESRASSVSAVAPRAIASRASASSKRVPMPCRCHAGSTAMVVTWPSLSDIIKPGVADDVATDLRHDVRARRPQGELAHEERVRPRLRVHLLLDAQHRSQVAAAHRRRCGPRAARAPSAARPCTALRASHEISASLLRRYIGSTSAGAVNSSRSYRPTASSASADRLGAEWAMPGELHVLDLGEHRGEAQRAVAAQQRLLAARARARSRAPRPCRSRTPTPVARRRAPFGTARSRSRGGARRSPGRRRPGCAAADTRAGRGSGSGSPGRAAPARAPWRSSRRRAAP